MESSLVEVSLNKITLVNSVRIAIWTAKWATIDRNVEIVDANEVYLQKLLV